MAFEPVTALYRATFQDNFTLAAQQERSRLRESFTFQPGLQGEQARVVNLAAARRARRNGERMGDTPNVETQREDVFCRPVRVDDGFLNEKEDNLKLVTDLLNSDLKAMAAGVERECDMIMAESFFGPRFTGKYGATVEAYNNPNGIVPHNYVKSGSAADSGLTFSKIVRGLSILARGEVDIERDQIYCAYTNVQMEDLYNQLQFTSKDFTDKAKVDVATRTVTEFMGVQFIRLSSLVPLPTVTGQPTHRRIPLYAKSGMHYGEFVPQQTMLDRNPQKAFRIQAYTEGWFGATRSEDVKVVEIRCVEA
jgi:hypothetical protein